jgi:hypothetical protein
MAAAAGGAEEKTQFVVDGSAETEGGTGHEFDDKDGNPKSLLGHILSSLKPGVDLSKMLIPPYFLSPNSLLEKMTDNWTHTDLFLAYVVCDAGDVSMVVSVYVCMLHNSMMVCRSCHACM